MSETNESFAEEVRSRRVALDLSRAHLGVIAGVSRQTIRNIEVEKRRVSDRTEYKIRAALEAADGGVPVPKAPTKRRGSTAGTKGEPIREDIARQIDALADAYPEDVLNGDSDVIRGARHAYRMAARIARGEQP